MAQLKTCTGCKEEKPVSEFGRRSDQKSGLNMRCRQCEVERTNAYRRNNMKKYREYSQSWRSKQDPDALKVAAKQAYYRRREDDPEGLRKNWRAKDRKRRLGDTDVINNYTTSDEQATKTLFGHQCYKCKNTEDLTVDHHMPIARGFGLEPANAVLLCRSCNSSKADRLPQDFYNELELMYLEYILWEAYEDHA